ncbi:MAG: SBBP repeat-containing protein [Candidatus Syntrophosphaera sp.]|nr:SBBP repeat-containing protein [Candidatus Syntrophosphaera sp.]
MTEIQTRQRVTSLALVLLMLLAMGFLSALDPQWEWAVSAGGSQFETGMSLARDSSGNIYVTGIFFGTAVFGGTTLVGVQAWDVFVAKLDPEGNWLWATKAAGPGNDFAYGIALDAEDNVYITGSFEQTLTFGNLTYTSAGSSDIFAARLDSSGNWFWVRQVGGTGADVGHAIAADTNGGLYLTGYFCSTVNFGPHVLSSLGNIDIFAAKLDSQGTWPWAASAGGMNDEMGYSIAVDGSGNVCLAGFFRDTATFGTMVLSSSEGASAFAAKLGPAGNWLWATQADGQGQSEAYGIAADNAGNLYLSGYFGGTISFGQINQRSRGGNDIFVAKLDPDGNWIWAIRAGGNDLDEGFSLAIGDQVFLAGVFSGDADFGPHGLVSNGGRDVFAACLDLQGNWLWVLTAGGTESEYGRGILLDPAGYLCLTGSFIGTVSFGQTVLESVLNDYGYPTRDVFVAKIDTGETGISDPSMPEVGDFRLFGPRPNPFNFLTTINCSLERGAELELGIYNLKGQLVKTIARRSFGPGTHSLAWDGCDARGKLCPNGIYLARLKADGHQAGVRKITLLRPP